MNDPLRIFILISTVLLIFILVVAGVLRNDINYTAVAGPLVGLLAYLAGKRDSAEKDEHKP